MLRRNGTVETLRSLIDLEFTPAPEPPDRVDAPRPARIARHPSGRAAQREPHQPGDVTDRQA